MDQRVVLARPVANRTYHQRVYLDGDALAAGVYTLIWDPAGPAIIGVQAADQTPVLDTIFRLEGYGYSSLPDKCEQQARQVWLVGLLLGMQVNRLQIFDNGLDPLEDIRHDPGVLSVPMLTKYMQLRFTTEAGLRSNDMLFELVWATM